MQPTADSRAQRRTRTRVSHRDAIARVVSAYGDRIVRMYSRARFQIFRQRFLEEIGQYLPEEGRVLDIGCGFGLFALYFATRSSGRSMTGIDLSERRIETARAAASKLGATNATFHVGDARTIETLDPFDAIYLLDVVHHIPKASVPGLFRAIHAALPPRGILVVKELDTEPAWQRVFSHVLDVMMSPDSPPDYWPQEELAAMLEASGFSVKRHVLIDYLPYPHVLFVATKTAP
jgi:2-polyprenyl-3-methyl-5-hydroxy-6-metoxy-1,4-benzoquinol methylase